MWITENETRASLARVSSLWRPAVTRCCGEHSGDRRGFSMPVAHHEPPSRISKSRVTVRPGSSVSNRTVPTFAHRWICPLGVGRRGVVRGRIGGGFTPGLIPDRAGGWRLSRAGGHRLITSGPPRPITPACVRAPSSGRGPSAASGNRRSRPRGAVGPGRRPAGSPPRRPSARRWPPWPRPAPPGRRT